MFPFLRIERPTKAILRPQSTATSAACCIRCTFEAKEETRIRPSRLGEDLAERLPHDPLRLRDAGPLGVRGVPEQEIDAEAAHLREPPHVGALSVDRRVVELVVAGVDAAAAGCLEHDRGRVGNRVRHADELEPERADLDGIVSRHQLLQLGGAQQPVLVELRLDEREREAGRQDERDAHLAHQIREGADVILVPVREHDRAHHLLAVAEIGEVRQDEIDAEVLVPRERKPGVHDDDGAVRLVDGHVLADLAEAAERNDAAHAHPAESSEAMPTRTRPVSDAQSCPGRPWPERRAACRCGGCPDRPRLGV